MEARWVLESRTVLCRLKANETEGFVPVNRE